MIDQDIWNDAFASFQRYDGAVRDESACSFICIKQIARGQNDEWLRKA